ncbi:UDP-glucuronosyltransferase 2B15-like isoform X2 [Oncorhynchus masou masou]|uniref:UDP-glucuronosyltransferase 2B15-like isoform X2 n=1 Tax=Oncorhynchus masou masou TaxID=90313 RepID=UPI003183E63D
MCLPGIFIVTLLTLFIPAVHGGKVLVFPQEGSHWVNMKVIIEALHSRGHSVSVVRPSNSWYIKETSLHYSSITTDIPGGADEELFRSFVSRLIQIKREGNSAWTRFSLDMELKDGFFEIHRKVCEMIIKMLENKQLMQSIKETKYDLVLTDPLNGGGVVLAHYLNVPLVFNVRWTIGGEGHFVIAPSPLSYVPIPAAELTRDKMTFTERVKNMIFYLLWEVQYRLVIEPHYQAVCDEFFQPGVDFYELLQGADLWLMRVDFVFEFPRPTMPNVIYMAGFQCKPAKPLPQELEEFVQSSGNYGVIIMSLGTFVSEFPHDIADVIAAAFAQLPQKVIWRHKGDRPATLGNNTLLVDWMPQNDLLGHPMTRLFVAHGGTNAVQEAIYHGIPVVGLPLFFDQYDNLLRLKKRGGAKLLSMATVDKNYNFLEALQEVLDEPSYRTNMQRLSRLHRDVPMEPLDTALFWIEFVMRHKGAAHLHTESYRMPWYSYHSVDVVLILLAVVVVLILLLVAIVRYLSVRSCLKRKIKSE